ncbi:N-acetylglucosamine-6-phosphate deacetylase [Lichenicola sp.]|uniref:N-acetylglucosamine-6-phosphate deacetylase n=1 Tax=Lichenicola sp. TaxID=2804529 RepID=UPI003AFF63D2
MFETALVGARIFTGDTILVDHALLLGRDKVVGLAPLSSLPRDARMQRIEGLLAPGFVDLQVNGGGGVLFNAMPTPEGAAAIAEAHSWHGSTALLPTFITDRPDAMQQAIDAVRLAVDARMPGIAGLHLEGPFLSQARSGAHDRSLIRTMTDADVDLLLATGIEHLLLTVAPEVVSPKQIERLVRGGVVVSLGHSDADADTVFAAIDAGATGVTHLFNAMSQMTGRAPGLVGAALERGEVWAGLIADLHHVDPIMMRIALASKRLPGRLMLVTDAMPPAGTPEDGDDEFELNGRTVRREDGRLTLADGTLAGSDLTMDRAVAHAVFDLDLPVEEALRMASLYPAKFMGMERSHGRLEAGRTADLVLLDETMRCERCWRNGIELPQPAPVAAASPGSAALPDASSAAASAASSIARA